jgi:DNA-binding transcriptional MerR regulator/methylmalonyl-CoA mutase cobalamin-binding subunit
MSNGLTLKLVSRKTGLSPQLIRTWEHRYAAVQPRRTPTNRRLYDESEVERLTLMRTLTKCGHPIRLIANLPVQSLRELLANETSLPTPTAEYNRGKPESPEFFVSAAMQAIEQMDSDALDETLHRSLAALGQSCALQRVFAPLIEKIGDRWREGSLKVANEHLATETFRAMLFNTIRSHRLAHNAPLLLVTTPADQIHELGALLVAVAASNHGWRVAYLGASLPAEEIAGAAVVKGARAVALSIVYPHDDPMLERELARLRRLLPANTPVVAGGRAAPAYAAALHDIGAQRVGSLPDFLNYLDDLRKPVARPAAAEQNHEQGQ